MIDLERLSTDQARVDCIALLGRNGASADLQLNAQGTLSRCAKTILIILTMLRQGHRQGPHRRQREGAQGQAHLECADYPVHHAFGDSICVSIRRHSLVWLRLTARLCASGRRGVMLP